ncbi:ParB N-terminal domain-containing protein [Mammaliicoccus fleurettii]|uniref:ParB N-terminal domain-containing protein n=1 Tax=Mammaliicoccus fleurettii TaxID=150056 RepID=UPI001AAD14A9|nr:ParB N-terminal domain-containing protein [Mammaliicoccus fleurettii]MBO3062749.1 ParB N-terminal domain-containing protein [Mammaliicoccus fleurettii]
MKLLNCEKAFSVFKTNDYKLFGFIDSNRKPKQKHIDSLIEQIEEGYELPPIIVKPNGQILDGQHRYLALKHKKKPIEFIIREDVKQNILQRSNSLVSKWTTSDHIRYHIEEGNEHFKKLQDFIDYSELSTATAARLIGKVKIDRTKKITSLSKALQEGNFLITNEEDAYQFVDEVLMKIRMESPNSKIVNGIRNLYNLGVDNKLLVNVINALEEEILLLNKESKITDRLVTLYNKQCHKDDKIKVKYNKSGHPLLSV